MGTFVFEWHHPAEEVFVTGTFDNWGKTAQLKKENGHFAKQVDLPSASQKFFYKFVVDGQWVTDHTAPLANDEAGNENNVLLPENITKLPAGGRSSAGAHDTPATASSFISGIAPSASTAALAGQQPLEKDLDRNEDKMPGAFPDPTPLEEGITPPIQFYPGDMVPDYSTYYSATQPQRKQPSDKSSSTARDPTEQSFGVAPIPASSGFGNPATSEPTNTLQSAVTTDKASYEKGASAPDELAYGVAPIPASSGHGNPIKLAPGEPVPSVGTSSVQDNVTLDKESYEKGGSGILGATSLLGAGALGAGAAGAAAAFSAPPVTNSTIPESSLPMGTDAKELETDQGPIVSSSAGPGTSTAALAGQVPLEPRGVPQVVSDSQQDANVGPEASASPVAVREKSQVEEELKSKVPEEQPTSENKGLLAGGIAGGLAGGLAAIGGAAAYATKQAGAPQSVQDKIASLSGADASKATASPDVPAAVSNSLSKAHQSPEAAANSEAVSEKTAVERELLKEVPRSNETGESAPTPGQSSSSSAPVAGLTGAALGGGALAATTSSGSASGVPETVTESQERSHTSPEASANPEAVSEKTAVESELLKEVPRTDEAGEPAPTLAAEHSLTAPGSSTQAASVASPIDIPSSDPNVMIADADTMPAIAVANGQASTSTPGGESHVGRDTALGAGGVGAAAVGGAAAYKAYQDKTGPTAAATKETNSGATSSTQSVINRVFGSPTQAESSSVPAAATSTTTSGTTTTAPPTVGSTSGTTTTALPTVGSTSGTTTTALPTVGSTSGTTTTALPTAGSTSGTTTTTSPTVGSTSGLNASARDPAQSGATEIGQLAKENETPTTTVSATGKTIPSTAAASSSSTTTHTNPTPVSATGKTLTPSTANPAALAAATTATKPRAPDSRDVSPFSKGPAVTTGGGESSSIPATSSPNTPSKKSAGTAAQGTATGSPATDSSKSSKRRSKMGSWFSEHFGSERKAKK